MSKILTLIAILCLSAFSVYAQTTEDYLNRGNLDYKQGNYEQAISDYSKAIEINPNEPGAYDGRAMVYNQQGKFTQVIADLTKVIEINPKDAVTYTLRGVVYNKQGKFIQAISDFDKAIEIDPKDPFSYIGRSDVYVKQRKFTQAISDYTRIIEINPNDSTGYLERGMAYDKQGNHVQASSDYNQAVLGYTKSIEKFKTNPLVVQASYLRRGSVYFEEKEYDKAWADVHKAESLGYKPDKKGLEFLAELKKVSGRDQ